MKKRITGIICALLTVSMLTGCGLLTDVKNFNFDKDGVPIKDSDGNEISVEVMTNRNKTAEIYFDATEGMKEVIADARVQGIVQDSVDAITKTWNDVTSTLYTVDNNSIDEQSSVAGLNNLSAIAYSSAANDTLIRAVENKPNMSNEKVIEPRVKLIITDLRNQLQDYQTLAKKLAENIMEENKSFALISIKTDKPFFIVAIGALNDLSSYIDEFYAMPNVTDFNPNMDWISIDQERNINCKIYAQNSGIQGVNYENIQFVEKGNYSYSKNGKNDQKSGNSTPLQGGNGAPPQGGNGTPPQGGNGTPPQGGNGTPPQGGNGAPPELPDGQIMTEDKAGSFSILRLDYTPDYLRTNIEGTANFAPEEYAQSEIQLDRTVEVGLPAEVDSNDLAVDDIFYIGFKSLLWSGSKYLDEAAGNVSGKIKIKVPFESIGQIQLSDLDFDVKTSYYDANKGDKEFYDSDKVTKNNIEVAFANNDGPQETNWRIDNQDKTAMINIYVTDLLNLSYATKLDITVGASDPGKIPVWVQSWTKRDEFRNLQSFVSLLNEYNTKDNRYEETITIYVMAGDSQLDKEISSQPFLEGKNSAQSKTDTKAEEKTDGGEKQDTNAKAESSARPNDDGKQGQDVPSEKTEK